MLPHLKDPPQLSEFVTGARDRSNAVTECLRQWDKIDAALSANKSGG